MATEKVNVVKIETNDATKSIKDLRKELLELKNQMINLEEGGEEFVKLANKAGELKHQLDEVNESIKGASSDFGDMIGNATSASAGLVGAFQAVEGALHLMGVESEAVTEAIAKMQSLMAITQGLASIDDGIKAFGKLKTAITMATAGMSSFKKALIGTGIGALVVALGTLIAYWDDLKVVLTGVKDEQKKVNEELEAGKKHIDNIITERERLNLLLEQQGKSEKDIVKGNIDEYNRQLEDAQKRIKHWEGLMNTGKKLTDEQNQKYQQALDDEIRLKKLLTTEEKKYQGILKNEADEAQKAEEQALLDKKKAQEEEVKLFEISIERKKILQGEEYTATYQYIQDMLKLYAMKKKLYKDDKVAFEQTVNDELEFIETTIPKEIEALKPVIQGVTVTTNPKENAIKQLNDFAKRVKEKTTQVNQDVQSVGKNTYSSFSNTVSAMNFVASSFTSMLGTLAAQQDTNTQEGFEMQKKLNISTATINGLMGILNAWVSAMSPANAFLTLPGQIALGAAQSIAMGTMMGIQIDAIRKQTFGGGNASTNTPMPNASALLSLNAPQYTQDVNGGSIEDAINAEKNTKVYVLESDITNTQKKVEVIRNENVY